MPPLRTPDPAIVTAAGAYRPGANPAESGWRYGLRFALVLAGHGALLWGGLELAARPEARALAREITVRLLETPPAATPVDRPTPPPPPSPPPKPAPPPMRTAPTPVLTAAPEAPTPSTAFTVAPTPPAPRTEPVAPAAAPAPAAPPALITAARFDADYLANPKPAYPPSSRRLGEEGKVLLRVHVGPDGAPLAVELKQSSGFDRLDTAARAAVERWRFVPAKRGQDAIDSWVTVPIVFSLQTP